MKVMLPESWTTAAGITITPLKVFGAVIAGLVAGLGIGFITEHYTGTGTGPVKSIVRQSVTGSATNIISGLGVGMISTVFPVLSIVGTILGCDALAGEYGIAMAAVGMLSTLGVTLATDAYGPVADNAGGMCVFGWWLSAHSPAC